MRFYDTNETNRYEGRRCGAPCDEPDRGRADAAGAPGEGDLAENVVAGG